MKLYQTLIFILMSSMLYCNNFSHEIADSVNNPIINQENDEADETDDSLNIIYAFPENNQVDVYLNSAILLYFNTDVQSTSISNETITVKDDTEQNISGTLSIYGNKIVIFKPDSGFSVNTAYLLTINGIKDNDEVIMKNSYISQFTTGSSFDNHAPEIIETNPASNANVETVTEIRILFNEDIMPTTITSETLIVSDGVHIISGTSSYKPGTKEIIFTPQTAFEKNKIYSVIVKNSLTDLAGNFLASDYEFSFSLFDAASTCVESTISGVTAPVLGATPVTTITETDQFTGTVTWSPSHSTFSTSTVYTATITLTAKAGYTLAGVAENFFTVAGANSVSNAADSGVVTAIFPATVYPGDTLSYTIPTSITFNLKYVPGGLSFKTKTNDSGTDSVATAYWIGETEVTYELWYAVRTWARANGYTFDANPGREGHDGTITAGVGAAPTAAKLEPVTTINWRESMVWCNALTEYYNANNGTDPDLDLVYYIDSTHQTPIKTATDTGTVNPTAGSEDNPYVKADAKGFRLPTLAEWSAAARYKGSDSSNGAYEYPVSSGKYWTPGSYASGATADFLDASATGNVAVYADDSGLLSTAEVKSKITGYNTLGLYDMSGNVWEWNFDWHPDYVGSWRVARGGSFSTPADFTAVGFWRFFDPNFEIISIGFRFARTE